MSKPIIRLQDLWRQPDVLDLAMRRQIVQQALVLLEGAYAHRVQKESMHAVNPLQRLRLMRDELDALRDQTPGQKDARMPSDLHFHNQMVEVFAAFRDLHTAYLLPWPYNGFVAYLPFLVESCVEKRRERFLLTRLIHKTDYKDFVEGVEIMHWNGVPIRRAIERLGAQQSGSNPAAAFARGLHALTMRPLARSLPPEEDWVTVTYKTGDGVQHDASFEWQLTDITSMDNLTNDERNGVKHFAFMGAAGIDVQGELIQKARRSFFFGRKRVGMRSGGSAYLDTNLPTIFRAYAIGSGRYGYLRIFSFDVPNPEGFVDECQSLLARLPRDGLVIDVRGNSGGNIIAAESLLQLFTPRRITPVQFQFANSPLMLTLCKTHANNARLGLTLEPWLRSMQESRQTGAQYSASKPISSEAEINAVGQKFFGPVVLITDPLCYSATDIFAAGFQDHELGHIIGVGGRTGAGGANVWQHALLTDLLAGLPDSPLKALPLDLGISVSIRRVLRVGANAGALLEDYGVTPDIEYAMTARDILGNNDDLIAAAVQALERQAATRPTRVLNLSNVELQDNQLTVRIETKNLARVDLWIDNRPWKSISVDKSQTAQLQSTPVSEEVTIDQPRWLHAHGFETLNAALPVAKVAVRI